VTNASPSQLGWPAGGSPGDQMATQYCLETLLRGDEKGGYHPWLAESYEVSPDYTSVTFKIRQDVKFHDGSDLTGEVVKWNLDQQKASGAHPNWGSIDLVDPYTVRVNFQPAGAPAGAPPAGAPPAGAPPAGAPAAGAPAGAPPAGAPAGAPPAGAAPGAAPAAGGTGWSNTSLQDFSDSPNCNGIVSKAAYDANGVDWMKQNAVGTGPFKVESFQRDVSLKFVRNDNYWVNGKPYLDGITIQFVADPMTRKTMVQTGDIDAAFVMDSKEAYDYKALGLQILGTEAQISANALIPDSANADSPWSKKEFREAVEYAIDKEALAKNFGYGFAKAPYQLLPDDYPGYVSGITPRAYDPEKAKQLLAQAGISTPVKTRLIASPFGVAQDVMVAVQADLAKVGIDAELEFPDFGKLASYLFGSWTNGAIVSGLPADINYNTDLAFYGTWSPSWARPADYAQAVAASVSSPVADPKLMQAASSIIIGEDLIIPITQGIAGLAAESYVMDTGAGTRGVGQYWNSEDTWLNK
jgi:ABC-type transport system substrate-binding protein